MAKAITTNVRAALNGASNDAVEIIEMTQPYRVLVSVEGVAAGQGAVRRGKARFGGLRPDLTGRGSVG